ncbi:MAG: hypothetical protein HN356_10145 [Calditrichaeota bacterium]|jgi:nitrate reductase gamma subunit|nr:hypothetical protein [Calditrichota bacterium]MBT7619312.1 hypothetical protein [Calditrichota bacterium]MBT7787882.1 hypothetical protein [Calditrichota bacterium]
MSELLHFAEHTLQEVALIIMACVYTVRVFWLLRFKAGKERQPATGAADTTPRKGILYSWANIVMPWGMESTRTKPLMYIQFVIFHVGVTTAIIMSFVIPYLPKLMESNGVVLFFQITTGAAFIIAVLRIIRRVSGPVLRAISTPDDYFSLILLTAWFAFAFLAAPNNSAAGETNLLVYFFLTAFFLIYVPFSKISHYLYYPFTRYYFGKSMGFRGVYPIRRG